jgi:hypothetical protein
MLLRHLYHSLFTHGPMSLICSYVAYILPTLSLSFSCTYNVIPILPIVLTTLSWLTFVWCCSCISTYFLWNNYISSTHMSCITIVLIILAYFAHGVHTLFIFYPMSWYKGIHFMFHICITLCTNYVGLFCL